MAIVYSPFQQRVVDEAAEINQRIVKLRFFLDRGCNRTGLPQVPADEIDRLQRQLNIMVAYGEVLAERIAAFSVIQ